MGPRRVGPKPRKKWGPEGWGSLGARRVGAQNFALVFACRPPGTFTRQPENSKRAHLRVHAFKNTTEFHETTSLRDKRTREDQKREKERHETTPQREKKDRKRERERKTKTGGWEREKARNFGRSGGGWWLGPTRSGLKSVGPKSGPPQGLIVLPAPVPAPMPNSQTSSGAAASSAMWLGPFRTQSSLRPRPHATHGSEAGEATVPPRKRCTATQS